MLTFSRDGFHAFIFEIKFKSTLDQFYCLYNLILAHTNFDFYYKDFTHARLASLTPFSFRQLKLSLLPINCLSIPMPILSLQPTALITAEWSSAWECFASEHLASSTLITQSWTRGSKSCCHHKLNCKLTLTGQWEINDSAEKAHGYTKVKPKYNSVHNKEVRCSSHKCGIC